MRLRGTMKAGLAHQGCPESAFHLSVMSHASKVVVAPAAIIAPQPGYDALDMSSNAASAAALQ